jgi:hypothetical protein
LKLEISERYLKPDIISQLCISRLKFLDDGKYEQTQFGEKLTFKVLANDAQKTKFKLQCNLQNKNILIGLFGPETSDYVGKEVTVGLRVQDNGKNGMVLSK